MKPFEQSVAILKALAHPLRMRIALLLYVQGSMRVGDISAAVAQQQPIVSQQLKLLKDAGVIKSLRTSKAVSCEIAEGFVREVLDGALKLAEEEIPLLLKNLEVSREGEAAGCDCEKGDITGIIVDPELCTQDHMCLAMNFCPESAIIQEGFGLPKIDADKCSFCERCVNFCPAQAFRIIRGQN